MTTKDHINPDHYKSRSIQCIEFTRNLDFSLGNAFKYAWRLGQKDNEAQEHGKINWYLRDALAFRPVQLHTVLAKILLRRLVSIADEFDEETFLLLLAIIHAASGATDLLVAYAKEKQIYPPAAHAIQFED